MADQRSTSGNCPSTQISVVRTRGLSLKNETKMPAVITTIALCIPGFMCKSVAAMATKAIRAAATWLVLDCRYRMQSSYDNVLSLHTVGGVAMGLSSSWSALEQLGWPAFTPERQASFGCEQFADMGPKKELPVLFTCYTTAP